MDGARWRASSRSVCLDTQNRDDVTKARGGANSVSFAMLQAEPLPGCLGGEDSRCHDSVAAAKSVRDLVRQRSAADPAGVVGGVTIACGCAKRECGVESREILWRELDVYGRDVLVEMRAAFGSWDRDQVFSLG